MATIRALIAILGMDQHELGAIAISRVLRDAGVEVVYAGRFNLPAMIAKVAAEEDVDIIGLSCHSWEYLYYAPQLVQLLKEKELHIPVVVGGSVITADDDQLIKQQGIAAAFGPNAATEDIVETMKRLARK